MTLLLGLYPIGVAIQHSYRVIKAKNKYNKRGAILGKQGGCRPMQGIWDANHKTGVIKSQSQGKFVYIHGK